MKNCSLSQLDQKYIWHPCTQHKDHEFIPPIPIAKAKGIYLYDFEGKAYIDCISSWWVNLFGHSHPYIVQKLSEQAQKLDHVLLAGFSHQGIIDYSQRLIAATGHSFDKCFYADNGSSAIEVALKMSFHKQALKAQKRPIFLALSNSYHGETIGALSVGDLGLYKKTYAPLLSETIITPTPKDETEIDQALCALESILKDRGEHISAFILEPLVQCAGQMRMYPPSYIPRAVQKCREYGIDIIFDEIAVGFGRTGSLFAFEQCGVIPDFLCLSKGITGGVLPLSVVLTHDSVFEVFYGDHERAFLHSHSYTGNALAIACANATLDLFKHEHFIAKNQVSQKYIWEAFAPLQEHAKVKNLRQKGMILAFDLAIQKERAGIAFYQIALQKGLLMRPLGNTLYLMPPYIITQEQIEHIATSTLEVLENL